MNDIYTNTRESYHQFELITTNLRPGIRTHSYFANAEAVKRALSLLPAGVRWRLLALRQTALRGDP